MKIFLDWFAKKQWTPWDFQQQAWKASKDGLSGLITVPTGSGKSYAAFFGPLASLIISEKTGLQILYITPLRALARDLEGTLRKPIEELDLPFRLESRTGDTTTSQRAKQKKNPPEILLTTPESLEIMICDPLAKVNFKNLTTVIVDEWHELIGSKRGVMLELALARLRAWHPLLQIWGLSATLGNPEEACQALLGPSKKGIIIQAPMQREVIIKTILPESLETLPWAGQLGLRMLPYVIKQLDPEISTLIFTNTRSQAERWYRSLCEFKPEWAHLTALHHSSIDRETRETIENGVKAGILRFIICTSSLDLGVDFTPVEKVLQIGSPKSIARFLQRAGRSMHQPMQPCEIAIIPTHVLELAEIKALRLAIRDKQVEQRTPLMHCYDVLIQHLMTCAIGGGFTKEEILKEISSTYSFSDMTQDKMDWVLTFLTKGGKALEAYPEFHKLVLEDGRYTVTNKKIALWHKMNIGTIPSNPSIPIKFLRGGKIGEVEEGFIARLRKGDHFFFAGKDLELVQLRDMTAYVRLSGKDGQLTPVWQGGYMSLSAPVAHYLRLAFDQPTNKDFPESELLSYAFDLQKKMSHLPHVNELLIETTHTREGWHNFLFCFEGRAVHEGLAALIISRLARKIGGTFTSAFNDYGLEILCSEPILWDVALLQELLDPHNLQQDCAHALNIDELAARRFRDIARIAGMVFQGYKSQSKSQRQIQASSGILFKVLKSYDSEHLLLHQAYAEVYAIQFQFDRLEAALKRLRSLTFIIKNVKRLTPFALPLYIEEISSHVTTETLADRIDKIKKSWKNYS